MYGVIIVGAGLSGLQAASTLHSAGRSVCVLEARDRVGGKTLTAHLETGGCVELGAAWINDTNQHRIYAYTQKFGLELVKQNAIGNGLMFDSERNVVEFPYGTTPKFANPEDGADLERIRDLIHDLSLKARDAVVAHRVNQDIKKLDNMTVDQYVRSQNACAETAKMVNLWTQVMIGIDSNEVSAANFIDYCGRGGGLMQMRSDSKHGGQYLRFRQGAQYVSIKIANSLPQGTVHLSCPVRKVVDHGDHVQVIISPKLGQPRSVLARKLIVSVPTPLYKDITFSPPLEGDTLAAVSNTKLGFYSKVIAVYSEPWWTKKSLCGLLLSYVGPIVVARDTSTAVDKQYSLTCFVNGSTGREWSKLPPHARKMRVLQHLKEITGEEQAMNPLDVLEQQWTKEEWSQGAVCPISGPGVMSSVGHMWPKSVGNFHFVGTEFAREWKGYMEGALCSGEDGAQEVLKELEMAAVVGSKL